MLVRATTSGTMRTAAMMTRPRASLERRVMSDYFWASAGDGGQCKEPAAATLCCTGEAVYHWRFGPSVRHARRLAGVALLLRDSRRDAVRAPLARHPQHAHRYRRPVRPPRRFAHARRPIRHRPRVGDPRALVRQDRLRRAAR